MGAAAADRQFWRALEEVAVRAATAAEDLLRAGLLERHLDPDGRPASVSTDTKSSATDLVTAYDRASEQLVVTTILEERPDDGFVGEEGTDIPGTSGVRWVIDPLDGTTNFVYGYPGCNVSVAAEIDGVGIVAGAVHDPLLGDRYAAHRDGGARRNGTALRVNPAPDLAKALVGTGFSYDPDRRRRQAEALVHVLPAVRDIRRIGAAAIDLCSVGAGRLDAFYEKGLEPWDHAAGALVAAEAGARVGDLDGGPPSKDFTLAAHPDLFGPLADLLRAAGALHA